MIPLDNHNRSQYPQCNIIPVSQKTIDIFEQCSKANQTGFNGMIDGFCGHCSYHIASSPFSPLVIPANSMARCGTIQLDFQLWEPWWWSRYTTCFLFLYHVFWHYIFTYIYICIRIHEVGHSYYQLYKYKCNYDVDEFMIFWMVSWKYAHGISMISLWGFMGILIVGMYPTPFEDDRKAVKYDCGVV